MSALVVAVQREGVRSRAGAARLVAAARSTLRAESVRHALVSITLVTVPRIAALNRKHLRHTGPTDVISFGFARGRDGPVIADIYIAPDIAAKNAQRHGVSVREELVRLVIHGVLHALGHDHPDGDARLESPMWRRQETLVRRAMRRTA